MKNPFHFIFARQGHACPSWCCFTFDNKLRTYFHKPEQMFSGYIKQGDTVLDIGPGQGYFTIPMARMVGDSGKVVAIDVQEKMLRVLMAKARKCRLDDRIKAELGDADNFQIQYQADFILAFWVVHEVPDQTSFLKTIYTSLKQDKFLFIAEPKFHVTGKMFEKSVAVALQIGFEIAARPKVAFSRAVLLRKGG